MWPIYSRYWWKEKIEQAHEVRAAMHTDDKFYASVEALVRLNHPYETVCVVAVSLHPGSSDYLSWVTESLGDVPK